MPKDQCWSPGEMIASPLITRSSVSRQNRYQSPPVILQSWCSTMSAKDSRRPNPALTATVSMICASGAEAKSSAPDPISTAYLYELAC